MHMPGFKFCKCCGDGAIHRAQWSEEVVEGRLQIQIKHSECAPVVAEATHSNSAFRISIKKPTERRQCRNCGGIGHLQRECPSVPQKKRGHQDSTIITNAGPAHKRAKLEEVEEEKPVPAKGTQAVCLTPLDPGRNGMDTPTSADMIRPTPARFCQQLVKKKQELEEETVELVAKIKTAEEEVSALLAEEDDPVVVEDEDDEIGHLL
ncbi:hypothetical protein F5883DRAFT_516479 [Diaporthe sp. PMI_573]|nr:hypothetical protein F5883DRAFT_516479 [Diaporthaceae sp. PMI_573]